MKRVFSLMRAYFEQVFLGICKLLFICTYFANGPNRLEIFYAHCAGFARAQIYSFWHCVDMALRMRLRWCRIRPVSATQERHEQILRMLETKGCRPHAYPWDVKHKGLRTLGGNGSACQRKSGQIVYRAWYRNLRALASVRKLLCGHGRPSWSELLSRAPGKLQGLLARKLRMVADARSMEKPHRHNSLELRWGKVVVTRDCATTRDQAEHAPAQDYFTRANAGRSYRNVAANQQPRSLCLMGAA